MGFRMPKSQAHPFVGFLGGCLEEGEGLICEEH